MLWLTSNLSTLLGGLVVWGFLMAFLFNVLMKFTANKKDSLLLFSSFIMFFSYFISEDFNLFFTINDIYFTWFIYDIVTLGLIVTFALFYKHRPSTGVVYIYIGLSVNSILFFAMHIDILVLGNKEHWFLWDIYSAGVNIFDFIMIFGLIINKDYLGLIRLSKFITSPIRKKALS